jgi:hypothetical protein
MTQHNIGMLLALIAVVVIVGVILFSPAPVSRTGDLNYFNVPEIMKPER